MALTTRQETMLDALEGCFLNITEASKQIGINRKTHYDWVNDSNNYKKAYDKLVADRIQIAESRLHKNISEGKETSLIFFLKCKGGYKDTYVVETTGDITLKIT